jgi:hypothetical protein
MGRPARGNPKSEYRKTKQTRLSEQSKNEENANAVSPFPAAFPPFFNSSRFGFLSDFGFRVFALAFEFRIWGFGLIPRKAPGHFKLCGIRTI